MGNIYKFHQDIKLSIWKRQFFSIEADSLEQAKVKALKFRDTDVTNHEEYDGIECAVNEEEFLLPSENGGAETIQLYVEDEEYPFATNASDEYRHPDGCFDEYIDAHQVAGREMTGYRVECTCHFGGNVYQAYHKEGKLVVMALLPEKKAVQYMFGSSWDELTGSDETFRRMMMNYLIGKYGKVQGYTESIHDWLTGHLTGMRPTSEAVDDAVPFSLHDLIEVYHLATTRCELHAAPLVGYQVVGDDGELPDGLFSFQIIRKKEDAVHILNKTAVEEPHKTGMAICPVYKGDIEEPSFI